MYVDSTGCFLKGRPHVFLTLLPCFSAVLVVVDDDVVVSLPTSVHFFSVV